MGCKYYVSRLSASVSFADDTLNLQLDWENAGTVPLYWDWPVMLKIYDAQGNLAFWETLDLRLSQLSPGDKVTTVTRIPISDDIRSGYSVGISIKSYDEKNSVTLAMDTEPSVEEDCRIIYSSKRK